MACKLNRCAKSSNKSISSRRRRMAMASLTAAVAALPGAALAANTYNFTGSTGGNWSVGMNWTQVANNTIHTVPANGDSAILGEISGGAQSVNFNQSYTGAGLAALTINANVVTTFTLIQSAAGTTMISTNEFIGTTTNGDFYNQSAGNNDIAGTLVVSQTNNSQDFNNSYLLSGTGAVNAMEEDIGYADSGSFVENGGSNTVSAILSVGSIATGIGQYTLNSVNTGTGTLTAAQQFIGDLGTGNFLQNAGTNTAASFLVVGEGGIGSYTLGGNGTISALQEILGDTVLGTGTFNQSGGFNSVGATGLYIGGYGLGIFNLSGGTLSAASAGPEIIGYASTGSLVQSNGNNAMSGSSMTLGLAAFSTGNYLLQGGMISAINSGECIGDGGTGNFVQSNGTNFLNFAASALTIGEQEGSTGSYSLQGGLLDVTIAGETVGDFGVESITQTGGTNDIATGNLTLGNNSASTGSYSLQAGTLAVAATEVVGFGGAGYFTQSGGLNQAGSLQMEGNGNGSINSYTLQGGTLSVGIFENIGLFAPAIFTQTGGVNNCGNTIDMSSYATYILTNNGTINAGVEDISGSNFQTATFIQSGGVNTVNGLEMGAFLVSKDVGVYNLSAGTLSTGGETIGDGGFATFNQTGGLNTITGILGIGTDTSGMPGGSGQYNLYGGVLTAGNGEAVGNVDGNVAIFDQFGGTNNAGALLIGGSAFAASYLIQGAEPGEAVLNASSISVNNTGLLTISQGFGEGIPLVDCGAGVLTIQAANSQFPSELPAGIVSFSGGLLVVGGLNFNGANSSFQWTGGTLVVANSLTFDPGSASTTSQAFGNSLTLNSGTGLTVTSNETIGGTSAFTLQLNAGSTDMVSGILSTAPNGQLFQEGGAILESLTNQGFFGYFGGSFGGALFNEGEADLGANFAATSLNNSGTIDPLALGTVLTLNNGTTNSGLITLDGGGITDLSGGFSNTGLVSGHGSITGGLIFNGASGTIELTPGLTLQLSGTGLSNDGTVNLNGGNLIGGLTFTNNADGVVDGPGTINVSSFINNGAIEMSGVTASLNGTAITNNGVIQGNGKIGNPITNNGSIQPTGGTMILTGGLTNPGTITITAGNELLDLVGFPTNAGIISLTGGTFDDGSQALLNNGQISGYGTIRTGTLTNNNEFTLTGGSSTVNGAFINNPGKLVDVSFTPAIFTGAVTNNGNFKITSTTVTFAGSYSGNSYISDPATNIFEGNVGVNSGGLMSGGVGDQYLLNGGVLTNAGTFANQGLLQSSDPINNSGNFSQIGTMTQTANMTNTGQATLGGVQVWGSGTSFTNSSGNSFFLTDAGSTAPTLSVNVTGGTTSFSTSQHLAGLAVSGGGVADLTNATVRIVYGAGADPLASVVTALKSGYAGGAWTGTGIISSVAEAGHVSNNVPQLSVGYADSATDGADSSPVFGLGGASSNTVLIRYAEAGDANLDGRVNFTDYAILIANFGLTSTDWAHGNFAYGSGTNFTDYSKLIANFSTSLTPAGQSSVTNGGSTVTLDGARTVPNVPQMPEPASAGLLAAGAAGLLGRRRRKASR